jgi:hypothetical protein
MRQLGCRARVAVFIVLQEPAADERLEDQESVPGRDTQAAGAPVNRCVQIRQSEELVPDPQGIFINWIGARDHANPDMANGYMANG